MRSALFLLLLIPFVASAQNGLPAIGAWREHLPYHGAVAVTASDNKIFTATPFSFFSVDVATKEVERFSKISGLSETGISTIAFNPLAQKLIVAYTNSNLDIITETGITNVPGLMRSSIAGDKTVYHILPAATYTYLSTGLGVLLLDVQKGEIRDSWFIGNGGRYSKVNMLATNAQYFYAATEEGLKRMELSNQNGADFRNWTNLTTKPSKGVVTLGDKVIALQNDSLFEVNENVLKPFYADGWPVVSIHASGTTISISQRQANGASRVVFLNNNATVQTILQQPPIISFPQQAVQHSSDYWVADLYGGLSHWSGTGPEQYKLASPEDAATGQMTVYNNVLYAAAGSVNDAWNYQYNGAGVYRLKDEKWTNFNRFNFTQLDSLLDFLTVTVDPRDESVWAGSYGGGLLHIKGEKDFEIFKKGSPIGATIGDPTSYRVAGLAFDGENNLWVANYGAAPYLHVLKSNGTWQSFQAPFSFAENAVAQILVDDAGQKWLASPKGGGLILLNTGANVSDAGDDRWLQYKAGANVGNLPSNNVLSLAKDKSGAIWVGTSDGMGVIPCPAEALTRGCTAFLPVTKDGAFAGYLFKGEAVRSIAVDGANRKWVATKNGAWLINEEGDAVLAHFTESNSPLLSNDVRSIAINGTTGEVFFGTIKGICSFRGSATEGSTDQKNLSIFPNPVPANFGGSIAIKGLVEGSIVKITELNGRLVYQTKALGGQALWNGRDYRGQKAASGVYLVLVTDATRMERAAGKIVFIQ